MASDQEMLDAMQKAVDALSTADRANSRVRFLAQWKALLPFLPKQESVAPPSEAGGHYATMLFDLASPDPALAAEADDLNRRTQDLVRRCLAGG